MGKQGTLDSFFPKKRTNQLDLNISTTLLPASNIEQAPLEPISKKPKQVENETVNHNLLELDPGLHRQIWEYPLSQQDEIRRAYLSVDPYRPEITEYPISKRYVHHRKFQASSHTNYKWLEYSPEKYKAFCKTCFIFNKPFENSNQSTFTVSGFDSWKKVRSGKDCPLLGHEGGTSSAHNSMEMACGYLMNQKQHLTRLIDTFMAEQVKNNRTRLTMSINLVRLFALQRIAFRGHDETFSSLNRGNFLEFLKVLTVYNEELANVRASAPKNVKYTCPKIKKEILNLILIRVKNFICKEIGDAKYCILVDEARDESKKEQMSIVLRFVDKNGFIQEHFFGLFHVSDTSSLTLKNAIYSVLTHYKLNVQNTRGQGYDGASNMSGQFNGLQAFILKDCTSAY